MGTAPEPGKRAPSLDLPTLRGGRVVGVNLLGGPILVSFLRHAG